MDSMKNNESVFLTDEQIADRALITYPKIILDKLNYDRREGYRTGWEECTEHYRELIEAGIKWDKVYEGLQEIVVKYPGIESLYQADRTEATIDIMKLLRSVL